MQLPVIEGGQNPAWSPDGANLAYAAGGDIWMMNANGTGKTKLARNGYQAAPQPTWSPGGNQIAFTAYPLTGGGIDLFGQRSSTAKRSA